MQTIKCREVLIKFVDRNRNQERIVADEGADCLIVKKDEDTLDVLFCVSRGVDHTPIKSVTYNYSQLLEIACEKIFQPVTPKASDDSKS